jgi:hypothetical protein
MLQMCLNEPRTAAGSGAVLRPAGEPGPARRIGIEDARLLPDGGPAASHAELITVARRFGLRSSPNQLNDVRSAAC